MSNKKQQQLSDAQYPYTQERQRVVRARKKKQRFKTVENFEKCLKKLNGFGLHGFIHFCKNTNFCDKVKN